ncbi:MAG: FHA domain-containing protein [Pirellulaceae bacterium]
MQVRLRVLRGKNEGKEVRVDGPKFLIGRADDCNLRPRSDVVSRRHCEIVVSDDDVTVQDLDSRNGTIVNEERIEGKQTLSAGDRIKIGKLEFEVLIQATAVAKTGAPEVNADDSSEFDDTDIGNWLDEAEQVERVRRLASPDTRQFKLDDTDRVKLETANQETEQISDHDTSEEKKKKKAEKKAPGKLPKPQGPAAKDSQAAASDMLKKFFNAR